jgi:hypothetical protein
MSVIIETGETVYVDNDVTVVDLILGLVEDFAGVSDIEIVGTVVGVIE